MTHDDERPETDQSQSSTSSDNDRKESTARPDRPGVDETSWEAGREERRRERERLRAERTEQRRRWDARKERVLHTRISEQLSEDIRRLAEDLRVPTSNLVRNVLEEVFTVVETVSDDVGELFEDVLEEADAARQRIRRRHRHHGFGGRRHRRRSERGESWSDVAEAEIRRDEASEREPLRRRPPEFPEVVGWQPLVLNQAGECADCRRALSRGTRAFVGVTEKGISRNTLCRDCLQDR
jgi:hypothetical protein